MKKTAKISKKDKLLVSVKTKSGKKLKVLLKPGKSKVKVDVKKDKK